MENKTPTTEEFIQTYLDVDDKFMESMREQMSKCRCFDFNNIPDLMNEFARFHLKAQAKAITKITHKNGIPRIVDNEESILKAYPLTNIK